MKSSCIKNYHSPKQSVAFLFILLLLLLFFLSFFLFLFKSLLLFDSISIRTCSRIRPSVTTFRYLFAIPIVSIEHPVRTRFRVDWRYYKQLQDHYKSFLHVLACLLVVPCDEKIPRLEGSIASC